ncbi:hypothetical protein SAMN04488510_10840 [Fervidobacterium changbaicum]|uniref:TadE-like protein n=1 Tax=Fervidobacterium changbaicum TaxID=310769 RepID=A0ABX5QPQ2_9BACT|nr:hypothetical protein [Fervidobacterium changbaicum]QAV32333.1 hypothetical protein CBS1_00320 [Fervidobacterium changbaicum]SDH22116.1 hypothetical protein SAMN04488510_10840 [Fervidobacterium changbaicum]
MYAGIEMLITLVLFVPVIIFIGTVGYELQIEDFSLIAEAVTRLLPVPQSLSDVYFELRAFGAYRFLNVGPFYLKFNLGQISFLFSENTFQFALLPRVGGTLEFYNLRISANYINKTFVGGFYLRF